MLTSFFVWAILWFSCVFVWQLGIVYRKPGHVVGAMAGQFFGVGSFSIARGTNHGASCLIVSWVGFLLPLVITGTNGITILLTFCGPVGRGLAIIATVRGRVIFWGFAI